MLVLLAPRLIPRLSPLAPPPLILVPRPGLARRPADPALDQALDQIGMIAQQHRAGALHGRQQRRVACQIGNAHRQLAGLARAEHFAGTAQFEVLLGDAEAVVAFAQYVEALARRAGERRL